MTAMVDDEPAHDVLAAEAFAMPAPDPSLHHGPLVLPDDPTGILEPHDVLAAEEFPMPAVRPHPAALAGPRPARRLGLVVALGLLAALVRHRLRREVTP
jgi:hypothetical protein